MTLTEMFQAVGLSYGWSMPVLLLIGLAVLSLATAKDGGTSAERVRAVYCHLMEFIGVLLMTAGALPALYAVFSMQPLSQMTYIGLLLVFAAGGLLFLWNDARLNEIDAAARATADALFLHVWKLMGILVVIFTALSLLLRMLLEADRAEGWWVLHLTMLLYGFILCWFTLHRHAPVRKAPPARAPLFGKKPSKPAARKR